MIKITIEQTTREEYRETENFIVSKTPTEKMQEQDSSYGRTPAKVLFDERYEPREVTKTRDRKVVLFDQTIMDDTQFDLKAVIAVINGIECK
jgi:hypothetical protein